MHDDELQRLRRHEDPVFRDDRRSPTPADQRGASRGLPHVPPGPDLPVELPVEPADGSTLDIPTSDGPRRRYRRSSRVRFEDACEQAELVLLSGEDEERLFLPFRDATSGSGSYAP